MYPTRTALSAKCEFALHREKAKSLFSSINRYRTSKNVPALTWNDTLYSYCVLHNLDMHASAVRPSKFSIEHGYNENIAHIPGSSKKVLDLWNSRNGEKANLFCNRTNYSAISVYGDDNECYVTQIFTEQKPAGNDKVISMKSQQKCETCKSGKTITAKGRSSAGLKAESLASTKLRKKSSPLLAKTGAIGKPPAKNKKPNRNQPLSNNAGVGKKKLSVCNTVASGVTKLGASSDKGLSVKDEEPYIKRPTRRTVRLAALEKGNTPRTGNSYNRLNRHDEGYERYLFYECPLCRHRKRHRTEVCDNCSTYV